MNPAVQVGIIVGSTGTVVKAFFALGRVLGWWDDTTTGAIITFIDVCIPALSAGIVAWVAWKTTIPKDNLVDKDGEKLVRKDTGGPTMYEEEKDLSRSIKR